MVTQKQGSARPSALAANREQQAAMLMPQIWLVVQRGPCSKHGLAGWRGDAPAAALRLPLLQEPRNLLAPSALRLGPPMTSCKLGRYKTHFISSAIQNCSVVCLQKALPEACPVLSASKSPGIWQSLVRRGQQPYISHTVIGVLEFKAPAHLCLLRHPAARSHMAQLCAALEPPLTLASCTAMRTAGRRPCLGCAAPALPAARPAALRWRR